ncbi:MAG: FAD binding domain-containing protein, partial [Planctomycetota bacterium]
MTGMNTFRLHRPANLKDAVELLPSGRGTDEHKRARVLAGGQDLLGEMKERLVEPESLIDLAALAQEQPELTAIREADGGLHLGALVTLRELERSDSLGGAFRVVGEAAASVGSPQIRSAGTLGGNLCQRPRCWYYRSEHAPCLKKGGAECFSYTGKNKYNAILGGGPSYIVHPSDLAPALVALGAEVDILGQRGQRSMELERFFTLPTEGSVLRENVLATDEVVTGVRLPAPSAGL